MNSYNKKKIELSVVVLGYRAGIGLKFFVSELIDLLEKNNIDFQIVLVGNYWPGSNDTTPEVVKELAKDDLRIKPIVRIKQGMMGWDMRTGLEAADGELISVIDGDGQMLVEDIVKVYRKLKEENLDFVKTYREKRFDGLWRKIVSFFYNMFFRILFFGLRTKDINSKPKIFTRKVFNKLRLTSDDWFIDAEIMIQIRRYGMKIGDVPTVFGQNNERPSFVKLPAIFEFTKNLIKARIKEFRRKSNPNN